MSNQDEIEKKIFEHIDRISQEALTTVATATAINSPANLTMEQVLKTIADTELQITPWKPWGRQHPCRINLSSFASRNAFYSIVDSDNAEGRMVIIHPVTFELLRKDMERYFFARTEQEIATVLAYVAAHKQKL